MLTGPVVFTQVLNSMTHGIALIVSFIGAALLMAEATKPGQSLDTCLKYDRSDVCIELVLVCSTISLIVAAHVVYYFRLI
jgi:hypothetical protein